MITGSSILSMWPGLGQLGRAVDLDHLAVGLRHAIQHARRGGDEVHVEFALEPLLHDLHVQQAEEAAAEAEAERHRRFRLEEERRVVEAQLLERFAQLGVLMALDRIQPGEHHRLELLEAGERRRRRPRGLGDGVADLRVGHHLDAARDEADFARARADSTGTAFGVNTPSDSTSWSCRVFISVTFIAVPNRAFEHAHDDHDAAVGVVPRVEDQRFERRVGVAFGRRQPRARPPRESPSRRGLPWRWRGWRCRRRGR